MTGPRVSGTRAANRLVSSALAVNGVLAKLGQSRFAIWLRPGSGTSASRTILLSMAGGLRVSSSALSFSRGATIVVQSSDTVRQRLESPRLSHCRENQLQGSNTPITREIVLLGGGHAHLQVLRRFLMDPLPGVVRQADRDGSGSAAGARHSHPEHVGAEDDVVLDRQIDLASLLNQPVAFRPEPDPGAYLCHCTSRSIS